MSAQNGTSLCPKGTDKLRLLSSTPTRHYTWEIGTTVLHCVHVWNFDTVKRELVYLGQHFRHFRNDQNIPKYKGRSDNFDTYTITSDQSTRYFDEKATDFQNDIKLYQPLYCVKYVLPVNRNNIDYNERTCNIFNDIKLQQLPRRHVKMTLNYLARTCNVRR